MPNETLTPQETISPVTVIKFPEFTPEELKKITIQINERIDNQNIKNQRFSAGMANPTSEKFATTILRYMHDDPELAAKIQLATRLNNSETNEATLISIVYDTGQTADGFPKELIPLCDPDQPNGKKLLPLTLATQLTSKFAPEQNGQEHFLLGQTVHLDGNNEICGEGLIREITTTRNGLNKIAGNSIGILPKKMDGTEKFTTAPLSTHTNALQHIISLPTTNNDSQETPENSPHGIMISLNAKNITPATIKELLQDIKVPLGGMVFIEGEITSHAVTHIPGKKASIQEVMSNVETSTVNAAVTGSFTLDPNLLSNQNGHIHTELGHFNSVNGKITLVLFPVSKSITRKFENDLK
ncbi:hypothetical protein KKG71_02450 [Patescibacteria group bacterium]|nr:hypothetical protein [Patescibacteria group bacterium]